jgi:hypothetical protein
MFVDVEFALELTMTCNLSSQNLIYFYQVRHVFLSFFQLYYRNRRRQLCVCVILLLDVTTKTIQSGLPSTTLLASTTTGLK